MNDRDQPLVLRIEAVRQEADGIRSFDLRPTGGDRLPPFTAGAHIDLILPSGLTRSYSLINPQHETFRYLIAVNRDAASRGGSAFIFDNLRVGGAVTVRPPRNNFVLHEDAERSLFIAGGIGITPIWCMIQRLAQLGHPWELYYSARTRRQAAFLSTLAEAADRDGTLHCTYDHEPGGKLLDIAAVVDRADPRAHLYCCGPASMLASFEAACAGRPAGQVHLEYFVAKEAPFAGGAFTVVLARSNRSLVIAPGRSILEALLDEGLDVPFSCQEGICGTCETAVIEGVPDHRDSVLDDDERRANDKMLICCSGAKTARLVLDL